MNLLAAIKKQAAGIGFDACGAARCRSMREETALLEEWIRKDFHAGMEYMKKHTDLRTDPSALVEGTKSVIVCLISYKTDREYPAGIPRIASYARFTDYHYTVKQKLEQLLERIRELVPGATGRCFVDSAPIPEKHWAVEAGLGWLGKNSLLIHPGLGSFCFIGTILTTLELSEYDAPYTENRCGSCRRCIDSCPTGAIREEGQVDARRCLSCQTIENRGAIPEELVPLLDNRLFGCDTCQDICPQNVRPRPKGHPIFEQADGIFGITAEEWLQMGSGEFKRRFARTPLARAGLKKLRRTLRQLIV